MKKNFSKGTKSAFAFALAAVLAVPTVSVLTMPRTVAADAEVPSPIAVYNFDEGETVTYSATAVDNPAKIVDDDTYGKVVKMDASIHVEVTREAVEPVTMYAVDYDKKPEIGRVDEENSHRDDSVSGGVLTVYKIEIDELATHNINSSIEVENPFAGRTDLVEEPLSYEKNWAPVWEQGVSISYWMKTNSLATEEEAESPMLSFNRIKDGMSHKDDRDKYNLAQMYYADKDNPLFSIGTIENLSLQEFQAKYPDVDVSAWANNPIQSMRKRNIISDYGIFACMNENFPGESVYYIQEDSAGNKTLELSSTKKIDLSKYKDVFAEGGEARYGTEKGCMTFLASGGYAFTETGLVETVYKGGKEYKVEKESERQFQRNTLHAYTYITAGKDKRFLPVVDENFDERETLLESSEWHYITYVIKNDSISLYVDGVVQDEAMFTNTVAESTLEVGQSFNRGFGYHNSASDAVISDIISETGGAGMFTQLEGYLIGGKNAKDDEKNIIKDEDGNRLIGYNGNCNADTLMEYLTDENTKLFIGEDGPSSAADLIGTEFGSKADTYVGTICFYDVPLTPEEVTAAYEAAVKDPTSNSLPIKTPPVPGENTPPATGDATTAPPTPPVSGDATTAPPTPPVEEGLPGDADLNGTVELKDATLVLKAALNIENIEEGQAFTNADINKNGQIDLEDATMTLKIALNIPV